MVAKASIIEIYARADAAGRVDIICKNYSNFIGIVDGYTEGLRYMIESEKAYNRKKNHGDLGVRVQTSGMWKELSRCNRLRPIESIRKIQRNDL